MLPYAHSGHLHTPEPLQRQVEHCNRGINVPCLTLRQPQEKLCMMMSGVPYMDPLHSEDSAQMHIEMGPGSNPLTTLPVN